VEAETARNREAAAAMLEEMAAQLRSGKGLDPEEEGLWNKHQARHRPLSQSTEGDT
jgi:hypothetical protein